MLTTALAAALLAAPSNQANWALMEQYSAAALRRYVYSSSAAPRWINDSDKFWYVFTDSKGKRFMHIDPAKRSRQMAFDHNAVAAALSELGRKPQTGDNLPFNSISYNKEETEVEFAVESKTYIWNLKDEKLRLKEEPKAEGGEEPAEGGPPRRGGPPRDDSGNNLVSTAPDKLAFFTMQGWNLHYGEREKEEDKAKDIKTTQLTTDGAQFYEFQGVNYRTYTDGDENKERVRIPVTWSEDSKAAVLTRNDARKVQSLFVINSLATPRPRLEEYKYQMPGEEGIELSELYIFKRDGKTLEKIAADKWPGQSFMNVHWTGKDHDVVRFICRDRLQRNLELCEYNVASKEIKVLITESVEDAHLERQSARYVGDDNTGDIVWWSERTGWGHFYLYSHDGAMKGAMTKGAWRAESLLGVDEKQGRFWFTAVGKQPGENLYNSHTYSAKMDGSDVRHLTEGDANHSLTLSKSRKFGVDSWSRPDMVPESVVRDDQGRVVMHLEQMDLSKLQETGWKMPEQFTVKSADGLTDIFGNMWKPFDFDPKRKYPVVVYVYPGPQTESVSNTFSAANRNQDLAQLGFIVLQIGNRGGTPQRDNAYHSYGYYNLRDYGLADKKAGIEELSRRHSFIDVSRVGIHGHSGGGFMTAAALMLPPYNDFFKVGVSSAGNHDNNIYNANWSEQHHGLRVREVKDKDGKVTEKLEIKVPTNAELAANLKGKLLLVHGDIDNNVHPAGTMRLVDALIKANKRFDFMLLPGQRHGFGSMQEYFQQMTYEYFARHLMGDTYDQTADMSRRSG